MAFLALALLVDGAYVAFNLQRSLPKTASSLRAAFTHLEQGEIGTAQGAAEVALSEAKRAVQLSHHPTIALASFVPVIGNDARAVTALAKAGELAAEGGILGVDTARRLGVSEKGIAQSIYEGGQVKLSVLEGAGPVLSAAQLRLAQSEALLANLREPRFSLVHEPLEAARNAISSATATATKGALMFSALPGMLGEAGTRNYLLAFQALGEARATGGVIGLYGVLRAEDGRLSLTRIGPFTDIIKKPLRPVDAPPGFAESYSFQSALTQWTQANVSPDFPQVAEVLLAMYREGTGHRLDGVLAMDPLALQSLMKGTGPLRIRGDPRPATVENVVKLLLEDSYLRFDNAQGQNRYLSGLVRSFWSKIRDGALDERAFADGLGEAIATQHVKIYMADEEQQGVIAALGTHGGLPSTPNAMMIFHNNYAVNKVDYFLQRSIETTVKLGADGDARVTTTATLENEAPSGPRSLLLGPGVRKDKPGINRMMLNFLVPQRSQVIDLQVNGKEVPLAQYQDKGFPIAWTVLDIQPGQRASVSASFTIPSAGAISDTGGSFSLTLIPQTTVRPDKYSIKIIPPSRQQIMTLEGARITEAGIAEVSGNLLQPKTVTLDLSGRS